MDIVKAAFPSQGTARTQTENSVAIRDHRVDPFTGAEKQLIVDSVVASPADKPKVRQYLRMSRKYLDNLVYKSQKKGQAFQDWGGRPKKHDDTAKAVMQAEVEARAKSKKGALNESELRELSLEQAKQTAIRNGNPSPPSPIRIIKLFLSVVHSAYCEKPVLQMCVRRKRLWGWFAGQAAQARSRGERDFDGKGANNYGSPRKGG